jgi:Bifunctional DNA primase/polymerase, N-terminal
LEADLTAADRGCRRVSEVSDVQMVTKRGLQWLSTAAEDPALCRAVWADDPRRPYLLATGRLFDVVVIPQRVGMETYDQLNRRGLPLGPVMADLGAKRVGFFLPAHSRLAFTEVVAAESAHAPECQYLGAGASVLVPGPVAFSGDRHEWLRAPMRPPDDVPERAAALAVVFVAAAALVARVERYGEDNRQPVTMATHIGESGRG